MEWLETFFGFSPDGGSGSLELALVLIVGTVLVVLVVDVWARHRNRGHHEAPIE